MLLEFLVELNLLKIGIFSIGTVLVQREMEFSLYRIS
jgi:hypothetical protein